LKDTCIQLSEATPQEIPNILPKLLVRIRMTWDKCEYYQNNDRICGLLIKISNEIIRRCRGSINVNDMFEGDVEKCIKQLNASIQCCDDWKQIYQDFKVIVNEAAEGNEKKKWTFTETRIFAKIDAFV